MIENNYNSYAIQTMVDENLKSFLKKEAKNVKLSTSSFVRQILYQYMTNREKGITNTD